MKQKKHGLCLIMYIMKISLIAVVSSVVLGLAAPALALHETETAEEPIVFKECRNVTLDGEIRERGAFDKNDWDDESPGNSYFDSRVQLGVTSKYFRLKTGNTDIAWSKGYWKNANNVLRSSPFAKGECTWYVDGKTASNDWRLVFKAKPGRNPIDWYRKKQISNGSNATNGYPGDIMIIGLGSTGHAAFVTSNGYWNGRRAWTVRQANWPGPNHTGQTWVERSCNVRIEQCTFAEYRSGEVKVINYNTAQKKGVLAGAGYPLIGFIHKK